jgi:hypothetical protein
MEANGKLYATGRLPPAKSFLCPSTGTPGGPRYGLDVWKKKVSSLSRELKILIAQFVALSIRPHETTRLPPDGF